MSRRALFLGLWVALTSLPGRADHLEELVVTASHDTRTIELAGEPSISPDVAQVLRKAPGANVNSNGPLTGIPQYRGMYGQRIAVSLDGNQIAPSGPNWMDPPLSYATSGQLESIEVYRGIVPVGVAQESIGGAVVARGLRGQFRAADGDALSGQLTGSAESATRGTRVGGNLQVAGENQWLSLAGAFDHGDDARFPDGKIRPTQYTRQRFDLGYGLRRGDHQLSLHYGYNDTGDSGTPALPMDIGYIEGDLYDMDYRYAPGNGLAISARLFGSALDHRMSNYQLRPAPADPARWRRNTADARTAGFVLRADVEDGGNRWSLGLDGTHSRHNSDIDNPNNPVFFVENFRHASRDVAGVFVERRQALAARWQVELGLRYNRVSTDAGRVDATPAQLMPPAAMLRDSFNAADREQADDNIDLVAKLWFRQNAAASWYAGVARKHRSPSYQERYLWLPLEATAGLADGNLYTGVPDLKPEVAQQAEFGLDFSAGGLALSPRLFYNRVDDYIQGTPGTDQAAIMLVRMLNAMNGTDNPDPLEFANVDAQLYGFDMDWAWQLAPDWQLSGLVNYVRGKRRDIHDNLYRIAPANASLRLAWSAGEWGAAIEGVACAAQHEVSETNREQKSSGYGLVNLSASWRPTAQLSLAAGVDNVFDRTYRDHLSGYNRVTNPDIATGERLPGYGANVYARASYSF